MKLRALMDKVHSVYRKQVATTLFVCDNCRGLSSRLFRPTIEVYSQTRDAPPARIYVGKRCCAGCSDKLRPEALVSSVDMQHVEASFARRKVGASDQSRIRMHWTRV